MANFEVSVLNKFGQKEEKIIEANDKSEVFSILKRDDLALVSIEKAKARKFNFDLKELNKKFSTVREKDKIVFARNLGAMIEAGLSVSRAIFVLKKQTSNPKFKDILSKVESGIKKGNNLSASLGEHPKVFSNLFVSMVKAGEEGGKLTESLKVIALQMEKAYLLKKKIKGALMYPGIILSAMIIIGILMMMFVVPTLTQTFKELDIDLPLSTRIIILVSDFMKDQTLIFLTIIIAIIVGSYFYIRTKMGKKNFDFILLHIPLISGLVKETNAARTSRTLSSLLSSGVEIVSSISITKEVIQNSYYKKVLKEAEEKVQKGVQLSEVFKSHDKIYPTFVSEMVSVGEETGKLPEMFERIALFYEEDIDQKTKNMSTIIEPFLMIVIGIAVGFFALSMITPTYSLVGGL